MAPSSSNPAIVRKLRPLIETIDKMPARDLLLVRARLNALLARASPDFGESFEAINYVLARTLWRLHRLSQAQTARED